MKLLRAFLALSSVLAAAFAAEKRPLAPQDLWAIKRVGGPELSCEGKHVAFTGGDRSVGKSMGAAHLRLVDVATLVAGNRALRVEKFRY